jgi:hypothetical protein
MSAMEELGKIHCVKIAHQYPAHQSPQPYFEKDVKHRMLRDILNGT